MIVARPKSLKRRLIVRLLAFQLGIPFVLAIVFAMWLSRADDGGILMTPKFARVAATAIHRSPDGRLRIEETRDLAEMRRTAPDFWFMARSGRGEIVGTGSVPAAYREFGRYFEAGKPVFSDGATPSRIPLVVLWNITGPAGEFTVMGKGDTFSATFMVLLLSNLLLLPILGLITIVTIAVTPFIVRRALAGLSVIAEEAQGINIDRRGSRLPVADIPSEVVPLVLAVNGALERLDQGYERHQRFIADAAHELRTPIAILQAKIEAADAPVVAYALSRDVARLATLTEQLLDIQRADRGAPMAPVDLASLARRVIGDLAPLVIASGGELAVVVVRNGSVLGDAPAMERVLANLVQNAIEHGGRMVTIHVDGPVMEVEDDGPGIPEEERERVFEPFHRLRARQTGAGLGLNLVRQIMDRHRGRVEAHDAPNGGTIMRLEFVER